MGTNKNAPLAQPDRVFGYEPKGQGFESLTARQNKKREDLPSLFLFCLLIITILNPRTLARVCCFTLRLLKLNRYTGVKLGSESLTARLAPLAEATRQAIPYGAIQHIKNF